MPGLRVQQTTDKTRVSAHANLMLQRAENNTQHLRKKLMIGLLSFWGLRLSWTWPSLLICQNKKTHKKYIMLKQQQWSLSKSASFHHISVRSPVSQISERPACCAVRTGETGSGPNSLLQVVLTTYESFGTVYPGNLTEDQIRTHPPTARSWSSRQLSVLSSVVWVVVRWKRFRDPALFGRGFAAKAQMLSGKGIFGTLRKNPIKVKKQQQKVCLTIT